MSLKRTVFPWLAAAVTLLHAAAEEPVAADIPEAPQPAADEPAARPWVGLQVGKLDEVMRAHATGLPKGVGFLVSSVDAGGPAEAAGVKPYDILWKLNEQLLVNEAQFATLLQLNKPGESIELTLLRSGERLSFELVLAEMPRGAERSGISAVELPLMPPGMPGIAKTIVYPQTRTAEYSREDGGVARLVYDGDEPRVVITGADGEEIYAGPVRKDGGFMVPEGWRRSVGALLRTMHHSQQPDWQPRRPRPRVVMPPSKPE